MKTLVELHLPGRHDQKTHGRRKPPGNFTELADRLSGITSSLVPAGTAVLINGVDVKSNLRQTLGTPACYHGSTGRISFDQKAADLITQACEKASKATEPYQPAGDEDMAAHMILHEAIHGAGQDPRTLPPAAMMKDQAKLVGNKAFEEGLTEREAGRLMPAFRAKLGWHQDGPITGPAGYYDQCDAAEYLTRVYAKATKQTPTAADPEHLLSRYIGWASSLTDSPVEYHELSGLTLLSMALHSVKAILGPHPDGLQANLYGLVIGDPGKSRKTTATGFARRIAEDFLPDSTVSNWHSPEGFVQELAEQSHKPVLLSIDEFAGYADKLHHQKYLAGQMGLLLSAYTSEPLKYRRSKKGDGQEHEFVADDVGLNILACCTPGALFGNLTLADVQSGLLPRFAVAWPEGKPPRKPFYKIQDARTTERNIIIARLNELRQWSAPGRRAVFEGDSLKMIDHNVAWVENVGEHDEALASMVQRLPTMLIKLCMCIAAGRQDVMTRDALVITPQDVEDALPILGRWIDGAERFAQELTASSHERLVRRALTLLRDRGGRATRSDISRTLRESSDVLDRLEETLRERRYITVLMKPGLSEDPRRRTGRSITEWVLLR